MALIADPLSLHRITGAPVSTIAVSVTASAAPSLVVDTSTVAFTSEAGNLQSCGTATVAVTSSVAASPLNYTVSAVVDSPSGAKWLTAGQGAATPGSVAIGCNPTGLPTGSYTGRVILSTSDLGGSSQTVNVTLAVSSVTVVSTASGLPRLAPGMIASIYGQNLSSKTDIATSTQLPLSLSGVAVAILDSGGMFRTTPLFSSYHPDRLIFEIPDGTSSGEATLQVLNGTSTVASAGIQISPTAPGLFMVGKNVAAATAIRVLADNSQAPVTVFQCSDAATCSTAPIDLSAGPVYVSFVCHGSQKRNALVRDHLHRRRRARPGIVRGKSADLPRSGPD